MTDEEKETGLDWNGKQWCKCDLFRHPHPQDLAHRFGGPKCPVLWRPQQPDSVVALAWFDVARTRDELRAAREVLARVEWGGRVQYDYEETWAACPCCDGMRPGVDPERAKNEAAYYRDETIESIMADNRFSDRDRERTPVGHAPDCDLAAVLG